MNIKMIEDKRNKVYYGDPLSIFLDIRVPLSRLLTMNDILLDYNADHIDSMKNSIITSVNQEYDTDFETIEEVNIFFDRLNRES